jgi:Leucine-rich repeat (LRR) protein
VVDNHIFDGSSIHIDSIEGDHKTDNDNNNVNGLLIKSIPIFYLPSNIEVFFGSLIAIQIFNGNLQEIHQSELKKFPDLEFLYLHNNEIKKIEFELFKFNENLKVVWLQENQVSEAERERVTVTRI